MGVDMVLVATDSLDGEPVCKSLQYCRCKVFLWILVTEATLLGDVIHNPERAAHTVMLCANGKGKNALSQLETAISYFVPPPTSIGQK
jgi:hypothetical protein